MFTHARCGGNLVEIEPPAWDGSNDVYARCDRCRLPGVLELNGNGPTPIFTDAIADEVRRLYWDTSTTLEELARMYDCSSTTIGHVVRREGHYAK